MTFRDWMEAALYDSEHGYYCRVDRKRWGREGDYRTSPERSLLFSATFARFFTQLHEELGETTQWTILECGAGEGHFAAGVLKTLARKFSDAFELCQYVIDEKSTASQRIIEDRLQDFSLKARFETVGKISPFEGVVFANELLDAFPVHRLIMRDGKLCEFYVDSNSQGSFEWRIGPLSDGQLEEYFQHLGLELVEGQIAEVNLEVKDWLRGISAKLKRGFVVLVDYGAEAKQLFSPSRHKGTLRCFQRHEFVDDILSEPGVCDITATMNWTDIKLASNAIGFTEVRFESQNQFLMSAGLLEELDELFKGSVDEGEKAKLAVEAREMVLPGGMSDSFQVLWLSKGM